MSLAEQLQKLQIPGQAVIQQISSKSVSLLFDARTAASLDNEAIQNIGLHGFEELVLIDPVFTRFEQLFNANSLHFQRSLEEENICKKIKRKIRDYLILLSPYLLLKPAQKTLEWLVRRYQCHIWDKDALIACILPFHESILFGRIIQLFGTEANDDKWDWMLTCQKEGVGFNTQSLINHCIENRNLLSFICKMADNAKEVLKYNPKSGLKIVFSFHARMLTSVIEAQHVIGEDLLSFLLPYIHSGLKSQVKDFACSTYMIITSLASKTKLMKDVTKAVLASILKSMEDLWYEEGLLCFICVIQLQDVKNLSPRVFNLFIRLKLSKYIGLLEALEKEYDTSMLVDLLIPLFCKYALVGSDTSSNMQETSVTSLKSFITNLKLSQNQISMICRNLIEVCITCGSEDGVVMSQDINELLAHLAKGHANIFDECISSLFNDFSSNKDNTKLQRLKEITMHCLSSEKHCVYGDSDVPLLLSLNHPESNVRIIAVQQLFATFKSDAHVSDKDFFTDAVIARLDDDNPDVVKAVLKYPKSVIKLLPRNILHQFVMKLMQGSEHYNINELIVAVIHGFQVEGTSIEINEFAYAVFGQLMFAFIGKRNKKLIEALDSGEIDSKNVILQGVAKALFHIPTRSLSKDDCTEEMVVNAFSSLTRYVADTIIGDENRIDVITDMWNYVQKLPMDHHLHFTGLLLLISLIEKSPELNVKIMQLDFAKYLGQYSSLKKKHLWKKLIETYKTCEDKKKYLFTQYYASLKSDAISDFSKVLDDTFFVFLQIVTQSFVNNQQNLEGSMSAKQKLFNIISVQAVNINSSHISAYHNLLSLFLSGSFTDKGELLSFLCGMYTTLVEQTQMDEESFQAAVCSLHITKTLLPESDLGDIEKSSGIIYATHVALLSNPIPLIRNIVLGNIKILLEIASQTEVWNYVLKKAKESEHEISIDPSSVKRCWQSSFAVKETQSQFGRLIQKSKKDVSADQKIAVLDGLIKLIKNYPVSLQIPLLDSLGLVDPMLTMKEYIGLLKNTLKNKLSAEKIKIIRLILKCVRSEMFDTLEGLFPLFVECMRHDISAIQTSAFQLLTQLFYDNMSSSYKRQLLEELLKILLSSKSVVVSTEVRVIIKSLDLDTENVASLLGQFCNTFDLMYTSPASNANEIQFDLDEDDIKMPMWRTLGELLDAVSYKEKTKCPELLIPKVFHVLERCLKCKGVEYAKQLLLQTLLFITRQDLSKLSEDQFQVELLIQCLQSSSDTHTSHQCLMVLSNAAQLYPTRVLHNVMHIFSFMGGTMLRLDNAYSFEIIEKTIDAVVPVLIKKDDGEQTRKRSSSSSTDEIVTFILQTFIDSIPHCPEHRRQHIIKHLVKLLHEDEHLHMVMVLLLKKVTLQHKQVSEEEDMKLSPISLEFCKDLYSTYPIPTQVYSLYKMVAYINTVSAEKKTTHKIHGNTSDDLLFDVNNKQANLFKYTLVSFTLEILRNENMKSGYDVKLHKQEHLTHLYLKLIEELLSYTDTLGKSILETKSKSHMQSLQHKVSEVISQLYDLLPFDSFITIVSKLLYKENELMRKKSLELLCKKLGTLEELSDMQENTLIVLCNTLLTLVQYKDEHDEGTSNKQLMLYAIKLIAIKLCKSQKETFLKAVPVIAQLYTVEDSNEMLSINAMLCVAELSSLLKADMLPYLPIIMKPLFLKVSVKGSWEYKKGDVFLSSCVTILHMLLKSLPRFLSPYVSDFLVNVASYEIHAGNSSDTVLLQRITSLKEDMGKLFPPRVLFPAIESCFESLLKTNKEMTVGVIDVYRYSFKTISKADANSNYSKDILNIIKKIFDIHSVLSGDDDKLCNTLENLSIQAFTDLILKLTENTLRPMYLELLNWSTETSDISQRLLSFYRLSVELSKSLKSLFLLFVGHVLKNCKYILTKVNSANEEFNEGDVGKPNFLKELVIAVLDMLSSCFFYDSQGFINKERFESILQPLVNQIENKIHGDEYLSFAKDHLSPCIVNFAAAVNDPTCWKQLNHQVLLRTKSEDEHVRLVSLYLMEKIYSRLGESYMILIPETIPFLAEILEDDSIEVEKQCQKVIHEIEEISGESIQKYF